MEQRCLRWLRALTGTDVLPHRPVAFGFVGEPAVLGFPAPTALAAAAVVALSLPGVRLWRPNAISVGLK